MSRGSSWQEEEEVGKQREKKRCSPGKNKPYQGPGQAWVKLFRKLQDRPLQLWEGNPMSRQVTQLV